MRFAGSLPYERKPMFWFIADLLLLLLVTLRLSRFVTTDSLGQWWFYNPLYKRSHRHPSQPTPWWLKYLDGLTCPFCVGFWIGCVTALSLWLAGGPGDAAEWWRWVAGVFALNWVVGHVANRLD